MRLRSAPLAGAFALSLSTPAFAEVSAPPPDLVGWAMMIVGFGATGALFRMRRRSLAL